MVKLSLFFFVISFNVLASSCLLSESLKDPNLVNNEKFWAEYSKLIESGIDSNRAIEQIRSQYKASSKTSTTSVITHSTEGLRRVEYNKRAQNELKVLPKNLKVKVDEFLEIALRPRGFNEIRQNQGRWNWEKIAQFGPHAQSVRLNGGYRILFDLKDDQIIIREINKGHIHGS